MIRVSRRKPSARRQSPVTKKHERPRPGHRARIRAGFSLIELLTVFVIAGLLGMISVGRISSTIQRSKVARASQAVRLDLQNAFAIATRNRQPIRIVYDSTRMTFSITNRAQTLTFRKVGLGATSGYN